jgi:hypothetical protein
MELFAMIWLQPVVKSNSVSLKYRVRRHWLESVGIFWVKLTLAYILVLIGFVLGTVAIVAIAGPY